ncbi:MAG: class II aldolase/adducin family protein [Gemmatimonadetes bacterium]|nr:class II aldolase/adducin family protein [Gemmatimonadota bacterium]
MLFSITEPTNDEGCRWFADAMRGRLERDGHAFTATPADASLVLNFFHSDHPRPFRRKAQAVFVVGVAAIDRPFADPARQGYPLLVLSLSNLFVVLVGESVRPDVHFHTLEQGHYVECWQGDEAEFIERIYRRIEPLASSRLVIENTFVPDLPPELWEGDEITASIARAGARLDALNLLPAPFPIQEILPPRLFRHVERLYGIGGLSYGNMSARKDATRFWMSASGVNKARLREIGRDILLVVGYDSERNAMLLSVLPHIEPRRVSVDAIEHWMIYTEHPGVGAILHVHAWLDGAPATEVNFPCGTYELGKAVADLVRRAPDPTRAVVGLRNHGLTITGRSLDEIFERVGDRLLRQVPML